MFGLVVGNLPCLDHHHRRRRRHHHTHSLMVLLNAQMLCTGIPELRNSGDVEYLRDAFMLGSTDEVARAKFTQLITDSLNTRTTVLNDAIHVFVHSDKKKKKTKKK
jgi:hypothetical protein